MHSPIKLFELLRVFQILTGRHRGIGSADYKQLAPQRQFSWKGARGVRYAITQPNYIVQSGAVDSAIPLDSPTVNEAAVASVVPA